MFWSFSFWLYLVYLSRLSIGMSMESVVMERSQFINPSSVIIFARFDNRFLEVYGLPLFTGEALAVREL